MQYQRFGRGLLGLASLSFAIGGCGLTNEPSDTDSDTSGDTAGDTGGAAGTADKPNLRRHHGWTTTGTT